MCSRENRGCHSSESSSCHGGISSCHSGGSSCHSGGSSCHDSDRSCHGSEGVVCHEVTPVPDVTPVVVLTPKCPVATGTGQVPLAQVPCQQQQQQIKQPVQWPPQQK